MREKNFFLIIALASLFLSFHETADAKRAAPVEVAPVVYEHVKYSAPHFSESNNHKQLSGYIEAWNTTTNKKLWELKIYDITYDPGFEKDVQEVYITSLKIEFGKLIVTNEAGEIYQVELGTHKVSKKSSGTNQSKKSALVK